MPVEMSDLIDQLPLFLRRPDPNVYMSDNYVVVDFETTTLDKGSPYNPDNKMVCSGYKLGPNHPYVVDPDEIHFKLGNEFQQSHLVDCIEKADFFVAHFSKFEYGWLERCGLPLEKALAFCTMIAEYVLLSNRANPSMLGLNACLKRRGMKTKDELGTKILKAGMCPSEWPVTWLEKYQKDDVIRTETLFLHQRQALLTGGNLMTSFTRNIFTAPIVDIEKNGMHLDAKRVDVLYREALRSQNSLITSIEKFLRGANPRSPAQMRKVLYEDLKFSKPPKHKAALWGKPDSNGVRHPTTSPDYISSLKPRSKRQREFQRLQKALSKVNAALSKSLDKFHTCCEETDDHILTAELNQCVTKTQRLSSTGKNYRAQMQNFARDFKPLFSARHENWEIGEIDQAQLEYRVAVYLGKDDAGLQDILNDVDAHAFTASHIWPEKFGSLDEKSLEYKDMRTDAKSRTFKPLYGGESGTPEEVRYYKAFKEKHKGITAAQTSWKHKCVQDGKFQIPSGLIFYFPNTKILEDGYITNSTNICNYPVQSFATADIVPIGVTYQWHLTRAASLQSFLINTIHDSAIAEVHPDEKQEFAEIGEFAHTECVIEYLKDVYHVDFNVPLEAEVEFNKNWASTPDWEEKYLTQAA